MAPLTSSQLLMLSVPAIAVLLNYLWFKRRRIGAPSDPGDKETPKTDASVDTVRNSSVPLDIEPKSPQSKVVFNNVEGSSSAPFRKNSQELSSVEDSPSRSFSRSFSAPIPIVLPKELRLTRTLNISDEELDQQIEKLKSSVKKADPFELINLGKTSNSVSPSQKLNGHNSISPEITQVRKANGTPAKVSIALCEENIVEEKDKDILNSPSVEQEEQIIPEVLEDKVDCCQEGVEEIVANEESHKDIDSPCQENSVEIIPEKETVFSRLENIEKIVQILQQKTACCEEIIVGPIAPCEEMTSTSNKEISEGSNSPCIEKMNCAENTDLVQQSPPSTSVEKVDTFICSRSKEITSSIEELTIANNVEKTLAKERSSTEERTSSTEERHSSTEERPASADQVSGAGTGAIPKKIKKKKFKKLDCDLKDLGKKLREKKVQPKNEVPERRRDGQKSRSDSGCEREEANAHSSGRQSANESPSEAMMVPSSSLSSLNESEGSNDSGKGCSDVITPPPQTNEPPVESVRSFYEFLIHKNLVGKLIGKRGSFVNLVYTKTNAHLVVKGHPYDDDKKVCIVEGTKEAIAKAMRMVKQRFPKEKLEPFLPQDHIPPSMKMENFVSPTLTLPGGLNLDTHVSSVVAPNHLFLQQPGHPTYPNFLYMHNQMNILYNSEDVPLVPKPIKENVLCVAFVSQFWTRVLVISADEETEMAYVKCLDFGGYSYVHFSNMKQIRQDFFLLPFQAVECFLANIEPVDDEWPEEAFSVVRSLASRGIVYTHVVALTDENIPIVNCQVLIDMKPIWINKELVKRGYAKWIEEIPALEVNEIPTEGC